MIPMVATRIRSHAYPQCAQGADDTQRHHRELRSMYFWMSWIPILKLQNKQNTEIMTIVPMPPKDSCWFSFSPAAKSDSLEGSLIAAVFLSISSISFIVLNPVLTKAVIEVKRSLYSMTRGESSILSCAICFNGTCAPPADCIKLIGIPRALS